LLLAIDNGTQSTRALAFDASGTLLAKHGVALDGYASPHPGWYEHDAHAFWRSVCEACQGLFGQHPGLRERIAAVAVTTQRATVVNVDANGEPLRPAITWLDRRKSPNIPKLSPLWRAAFAAARVTETITYLQREAEANWIRAEEPRTWERTHKFLLLSGYLNYRLTGDFVDSSAAQVGYIPFDYKRHCWAKDSDWKWQAVPMERSMLPELAAPSSILGEVSAAAAAQTGIAAGTPVVAAGTDKACEVLGAGCIDSSIAALSFGSAATINACSPKYVEPIPFIPPYPAAMPGAYNVEVQIFRGFWMVRWFMEQFGIADERDLDNLVASVQAGSMGLLIQPYWAPGLRSPGPHAKGAMIGFAEMHGKAQMYRALLEGLAFALREGKERIESRGRFRVKMLRVAGGGSQSDAAMQLTADVFGLAAQRPHTYETSGLGAAIDAAVALQMHPGFPEAVARMTRVERTFEPQTGTRYVYDALYERVYKKMYRRLEPLYAEISKIIGYPPPPDVSG